MTIRLRAHHLLCMLTYAGRGYSPAFTANYDRLAARIAAGEDLLLVQGPDDICRPLLAGQAPHCLRRGPAERDAAAATALARLLDRPIAPGIRLVPDDALLERLRAAFAKGSTRKACLGCEWSDFCSSIARDGFRAAAL
ncbi:DUF1284 domain-containing protein [Nitratireductor sp. ZSWI3]|uniref:DUF1284 domain-containing protein n=1 Tax=Nitratireductor sp. ZSWI3 TaxID=2966359 RepID=UPI002150334F|nr:DUF1284 domain-containing protein [Nitratireductor sp. ZSWI3]MCR4269125.1 DUF1284 domain-containing protein [Nitratireductor sp. ZSWI3]